MELWTAEDKAIISKNSVTAKTYNSKVKSVGFANYVKGLGGIFEKLYGNSTKISTVQELHERMRFVCGLMAIFRFCYWNGSTWWYWLNSASKSFYSSKVTNKGCRGGTIYQLCQGTDGRLRITCCNYGVDTLLKACGIYSLKKTTVTSKAKLVPGDVIDLYRKSDGKWHHQVMVHSISGGKIWCCDFGNRFIKTGVPLHYMSLSGSTAGGEYGTDSWKGRHRLTLKTTQEIPTMNGIDIASYQSGIDFAKVPCDFVIIKATQGTSYVNPDCNRAYSNAKANGKLIGLYHYASGENAINEADYFIKNISNYVGSAVLALDWESAQNSSFGKVDVTYCKTFLDRIYQKTGVRPLIYMSQSVCLAHDWKSVASDYGLWVARYPDNNPTGYRNTKDYGNIGAWQFTAIYQYTSKGQLAGWSGNLDLDIAYMDKSAWQKYAKGNKAEEKEEVPVPRTIKQGSTGKLVKWLQIYLGNLTVDGRFGAKTKAALVAWQKKQGVAAVGQPDGVCGPKSWRRILESLA